MDINETGTCWENFQRRIEKESFDEQGKLHDDFLRRGILSGAMHCPQFDIGHLIMHGLAGDPFGSILLARVQSSPFGDPVCLPGCPLWSTVDLQTLLYLQIWKEKLGVDVTREMPDYYVDFGGGYGLFSRAVALLNHRSVVTVVDLPVVSEVQRQYHEMTLGYQQRSRIGYQDGSLIATDGCEFSNHLRQRGHYCFHATYSLSETTLPARERLVRDLVAGSERFLIVFQDTFRDTLEGGPIDNVSWFEGPFRQLVPDHKVECELLPFHAGSHVIWGSRKPSAGDK